MSWRAALNRKVEIVTLLSVICCALIYWQNNYKHFRASHCACHRCLTEDTDVDPWFSERYRASFHPLMSKNSSILSEKAYTWWMRLQPFGGQPDYRTTVEKLFKLIPDQEYYRDRGPNRCRVCSVVGNSGNLKNSHYGPLIDSSDLVLRVNQGPTKGFEQDVGSKTTHRIIYPESAFDVEDNAHLVLVAFKTLDLDWLINVFTTHRVRNTYKAVRSSIKANTSQVMVVNPSFMQYVHETWLKKNGHQPSTGFLTIIIALHICDKVRVFGFGANKDGTWDHYFENIPKSFKTGGHKGSFEYDTIKELDKRNRVEMFRGW